MITGTILHRVSDHIVGLKGKSFACERCDKRTRSGLSFEIVDDVLEVRAFLAAHGGAACARSVAS